MTLKKIHYLSGLCISLFIGFHLFNHIVALQGAEKHIATMQSFRGIYRNVFAETILLAAVLVQIISGVRLFKTGRKTALGFYDKLHYRTGLYMAFFLVIHVSAVLAGRYILKLDTNFYFGVAGLNSFPFNLFFIPYYGLAILSFFGHIAAVHSKKMKIPLLGLLPKQQANIILASGFIITMIIFYGLTNHFKGVLIPAEYNILTGK
jgi:succinate dehydrogenase/fumarate reductase cytochrome b subunit